MHLAMFGDTAVVLMVWASGWGQSYLGSAGDAAECPTMQRTAAATKTHAA